jgi:hypothetical protein
MSGDINATHYPIYILRRSMSKYRVVAIDYNDIKLNGWYVIEDNLRIISDRFKTRELAERESRRHSMAELRGY